MIYYYNVATYKKYTFSIIIVVFFITFVFSVTIMFNYFIDCMSMFHILHLIRDVYYHFLPKRKSSKYVTLF